MRQNFSEFKAVTDKSKHVTIYCFLRFSSKKRKKDSLTSRHEIINQCWKNPLCCQVEEIETINELMHETAHLSLLQTLGEIVIGYTGLPEISGKRTDTTGLWSFSLNPPGQWKLQNACIRWKIMAMGLVTLRFMSKNFIFVAFDAIWHQREELKDYRKFIIGKLHTYIVRKRTGHLFVHPYLQSWGICMYSTNSCQVSS